MQLSECGGCLLTTDIPHSTSGNHVCYGNMIPPSTTHCLPTNTSAHIRAHCPAMRAGCSPAPCFSWGVSGKDPNNNKPHSFLRSPEYGLHSPPTQETHKGNPISFSHLLSRKVEVRRARRAGVHGCSGTTRCAADSSGYAARRSRALVALWLVL